MDGNPRKRNAWTIIDQAFSSLTNFGASFVAARLLTPADFGRFGVVSVALLFGSGIYRSLVAEPMVVLADGEGHCGRRVGLAQMTGRVSVGLCLIVAVAAFAVPIEYRWALLAGAVVLPGLLFHEGLRHAAFAERRPRRAAEIDILWLALLVAGFLLIVEYKVPSPSLLILGWGAAGTIAASMRVRHILGSDANEIASGRRLVRELGRPLLLEYVLIGAASQAMTFGAAALVGPTGAAGWRGAQLLAGPISVMTSAVALVVMQEKRLLVSQSGAAKRVVSVALFPILASACWFGILLTVPRFGALMLGETWPLTRRILGPLVVSTVATSLVVIGNTALKVRGRVRQLLKIRACLFAAVVLFGTAGLGIRGLPGGLWAVAISNCAAALSLMWLLMSDGREHASSIETARRTSNRNTSSGSRRR